MQTPSRNAQKKEVSDMFSRVLFPPLLTTPLPPRCMAPCRRFSPPRKVLCLERDSFGMDLSTKFGKEIPSRNLHEKRSDFVSESEGRGYLEDVWDFQAFSQTVFELRFPLGNEGKEGKNLSSQTWPGSSRHSAPRHLRPPDRGWCVFMSHQGVRFTAGNLWGSACFWELLVEILEKSGELLGDLCTLLIKIVSDQKDCLPQTLLRSSTTTFRTAKLTDRPLIVQQLIR